MGLNGSKFTRNDKVPGRGLVVLVDAKTLQVKQNQLDRLFHEFFKLSGEDDYKVDVEAFCAYHQVEYSPWIDLFFQMTEPDKSGEMDFYQYLVCSWNFLSTEKDNLAAMIFNIFDVDTAGVLEAFEVKFILQLIHGFNPGIFARWAIEKLDYNEDGLVTIAEFVLLTRHHTVLLVPLVNLRKTIRKKLVHSRFWREMASTRARSFGSHNWYDILGRPHDLIRDWKLRSIWHLMERRNADGELSVPSAYSDKWRDLQHKKQDLISKKELLTEELPPETLTEQQKGMRLMFPNEYRPNKKKKDKGAFAHLHPDFEDDKAMLSENDDRVNKLVESLQAEAARVNFQKKREKRLKKMRKGQDTSVLGDPESTNVPHSSVKPVVPGLPTGPDKKHPEAGMQLNLKASMTQHTTMDD